MATSIAQLDRAPHRGRSRVRIPPIVMWQCNEEPENCAECDGTGVSHERGRIVCRPCHGTGAALPSTADALAARGGK